MELEGGVQGGSGGEAAWSLSLGGSGEQPARLRRFGRHCFGALVALAAAVDAGKKTECVDAFFSHLRVRVWWMRARLERANAALS